VEWSVDRSEMMDAEIGIRDIIGYRTKRNSFYIFVKSIVLEELA
jgi:hypothetical protein